jgi:hypothetical protein
LFRPRVLGASALPSRAAPSITTILELSAAAAPSGRRSDERDEATQTAVAHGTSPFISSAFQPPPDIVLPNGHRAQGLARCCGRTADDAHRYSRDGPS